MQRAETIDLLLSDESATAAWAAGLARAVAAQPLSKQAFVVHLKGDVGAGKTALARGILRGFGFSGAVKSPTFTLLEPYTLERFSVYHFDLYRFSYSEQWIDAGFDDILASPGLMLIEWPENAAGTLAAPDLLLELAATDAENERRLRVQAGTEAGQWCLRLSSDPAAHGPSPPAPATDEGS